MLHTAGYEISVDLETRPPVKRKTMELPEAGPRMLILRMCMREVWPMPALLTLQGTHY